MNCILYDFISRPTVQKTLSLKQWQLKTATNLHILTNWIQTKSSALLDKQLKWFHISLWVSFMRSATVQTDTSNIWDSLLLIFLMHELWQIRSADSAFEHIALLQMGMQPWTSPCVCFVKHTHASCSDWQPQLSVLSQWWVLLLCYEMRKEQNSVCCLINPVSLSDVISAPIKLCACVCVDICVLNGFSSV